MAKKYTGIVKAFSDHGQTDSLSPDDKSSGTIYSIIAGRAGVEALFPEASSSGCDADLKTLERLTEFDPAIIAMHRWKSEHPAASIEDFYQEFKKPVQKILRSKQARRAAAALCKALCHAGTLSGQEAASILEKAWGDPLPPLALPIERHIALNDKGPRCFNDAIRAADIYLEVIQKDFKEVLGDCENEAEIKHLSRVLSSVLFLRKFVNPPPSAVHR